jgi:hypothetical protein
MVIPTEDKPYKAKGLSFAYFPPFFNGEIEGRRRLIESGRYRRGIFLPKNGSKSGEIGIIGGQGRLFWL